MFNLDDFIGKIFVIPPEPDPPATVSLGGYLPPIHISDKMKKSFDKDYLDFIVNLYMKSKKSGISDKNHHWFYEEIAHYLHKCYPNLSMQEYESILNQIIKEKK